MGAHLVGSRSRNKVRDPAQRLNPIFFSNQEACARCSKLCHKHHRDAFFLASGMLLSLVRKQQAIRGR